MKTLLHLLGFFWCLPVTLIGLVLMGIADLMGEVGITYFRDDFQIVWDLKNDGWVCRKVFLGRGWGGFSFGANVIVVDSDSQRWQRTVRHEAQHGYQQYALGILYLPVYFLIGIFMWVFCRELHSYYDHPFEVSARKAAGQLVKIPKAAWKDGPYDRWAWW